MSILFITKLKTWMFLSYACHSLIQDNVFHIFTLTAHLNDTWEHRRTGRGGQGGSCPPNFLAVCRHEFGQRVDIIRAKTIHVLITRI